MVKPNKVKRNGNTFEQSLEDSDFIADYKEWKDHCLSIDESKLMVKNETTLFDFLLNHVFNNIREGSVNRGRDGEGAREALEVIEGLLEDNDGITVAKAKIINSMADVIFALKDDTLDPKDILFTEYEEDEQGDKVRPVTVRGHYRTEKYAEKHGGKATPTDWRAGKNPPHMALFSEGESEFAKPKGLYYILKEAKAGVGKKGEKTIIDYVYVNNLVLSESKTVTELEKLAEVEKYADKIVNNTAFWKGGKLMIPKLRKDLQRQIFRINRGKKEQTAVRALTGAGALTDNNSLAGTIERFKIDRATSLPLIKLIENALKRKGTNKAPDGYRAWQSERKGGFDYRKTRREKFGEDAQGNLDAKVISKMWQSHLWRS